MLSYQHGYHAGCFADVVKHLTLTRITNYLIQKDKPAFYLETHSGRGIYDLKDGQATKNSEFLQGISLLWDQRKQLSPLFAPYMDVIKSLNPSGVLRYYPGSPYLAMSGLRATDRLVCAELHQGEFSHLEKSPIQGRNVYLKHADGMKELNALLPPIERRGLIFMDPSWEIKDEYKTIPNAIKQAYSRFATGTYCLWYPIIDNRLHNQLVTNMKSTEANNALQIEFYMTSKAQQGMTGCGLWIINPPYLLANEMKSILDYLRTIFNKGVSSYLIQQTGTDKRPS